MNLRNDRADAARPYPPAEGVPTIPAEEYTPTPRLMGRADALLAPRERLTPHYYALECRTPHGLLCVPSEQCGADVIALYATPADALLARTDWFRRRFSEVLCVAEFHDVAGLRPLTRAQALDIRRREAEARGETLPAGWPSRPAPAPRPVPPLRGYYAVWVLAAALALLGLALGLH